MCKQVATGEASLVSVAPGLITRLGAFIYFTLKRVWFFIAPPKPSTSILWSTHGFWSYPPSAHAAPGIHAIDDQDDER